MTTIWKFQLQITDEQVILMPWDATALSVQFQNGELCLWSMLNPSLPKTERRFRIFGTGYAIDVPISELFHVGTVSKDGLVWHVFEMVEMGKQY